MKHKKKIIIEIGVVGLFIVCGIGITYSLWSKTFIQTNENTLVSDCFSISFEEMKDTSIYLENTFPMTDKEGSRLKPYQFKVKNNCDAYAKYSVLLDVPTSVSLNAEYLKVKLDDNKPRLLNDYSLDILNKDENKNVYILDEWYLKFQEEREYKFLVWIDENVTQNTEGAQNGNWSGKIRISASYASEGLQDPGTLRKISSSDQEGMWGYKNDITKIIIQNKLEEIEEAVESYDESILQDGSVMSYLVLNEDGTYTAYLQSNKELHLNSGLFLFSNFSKVTEIEGLEYVNTSQATNMAFMFSSMSNLTSLDVSGFDTSNVVTMESMFSHMNNLTNLDVSSFDTLNVTDMSDMFNLSQNLTSITYGNTFIYANNATIDRMFSLCPANKPSHESWTGKF